MSFKVYINKIKKLNKKNKIIFYFILIFGSILIGLGIFLSIYFLKVKEDLKNKDLVTKQIQKHNTKNGSSTTPVTKTPNRPTDGSSSTNPAPINPDSDHSINAENDELNEKIKSGHFDKTDAINWLKIQTNRELILTNLIESESTKFNDVADGDVKKVYQYEKLKIIIYSFADKIYIYSLLGNQTPYFYSNSNVYINYNEIGLEYIDVWGTTSTFEEIKKWLDYPWNKKFLKRTPDDAKEEDGLTFKEYRNLNSNLQIRVYTT